MLLLAPSAIHGPWHDQALLILTATMTISVALQMWVGRSAPPKPQTRADVLWKLVAGVLGFVAVLLAYRYFGRSSSEQDLMSDAPKTQTRFDWMKWQILIFGLREGF